MLSRLKREPWTDRQAAWRLGAVACLVLLIIVLMVGFVAVRAWPALQANGYVTWLGSGGDVDRQLGDMIKTGQHPPDAAYHLRAWPLVYGTLLTTGVAVVVGLGFSLFSAIFIVEFAPARVRAVVVPAVRLLAAVPSVIYGLIGILVLAPFVGNHLISLDRKASVQNVVQLDGTGVLVAIVVLTVMITPIMIAIVVDALRAIPTAWTEGASALGANRWEAIWTVSVRAARPAIVAAAVLATARALGEAVALSMVSGSRGFSPNPVDGITYIFEPIRPLAASMVENVDAINAPAVKSSVYAFALLLLLSSLALSIGGYVAKLPMRRQGLRI
ncbi:MAG: phosphate transport system permease protein [Baekduia sp.]|jgi:phosphate ABC transporter permease protein PstC|nr:phosphate transport system permease protein [Baekduia sp.]